MTVYVDDVRHPFGRMVMCHMWADTEEELLQMAVDIGLPTKWIQRPPKASWVHFDVSLTMKALAIVKGAVLTDKYGPVEHTWKLRLTHENPKVREMAEDKLDQIKRLRAKRDSPTEPEQIPLL